MKKEVTIVKVLALIGDPGTIAITLNRIFACNPGLTVLSTTAGPWFVQTEQLAVTRLLGPQAPQLQQLNAFYLTYTDCDVLLDENGEPLKF